MDLFQLLFVSGSALLMLVQGIRGWRLGVVRQLVNLVALVFAYATAMVSGRVAAPLLHPLGYPDLLLSTVSGAVIGSVVYFALNALGAMLFRKTNEQSLGLLRLGYGAGGSALGLVGALVTVWLSVLAIRFLGTVAQAEVNISSSPAAARAGITPSPMALEITRLNHSINSSAAGALIKGTDPVPNQVYAIVEKLTQVISNVDSMRRFVAFPGARVIARDPHIVALQKDPEIARQVSHGNILGLLGNARIVAAINDPALESLVRDFELEKALDYALSTPEKDGPGSRRQHPY